VRNVIKKIVDILNGIAILGLLMAYLAPYVDPQDFWPIAFFGLSYKLWFLGNIFLFIFWLSLKRIRWIYNAAFLLLGTPFIGRNIQFNASSYQRGDLKIASFNTNVQQVYNGGNTSKEIDSLLTVNKYDVAVLIEWFDKKGSINRTHYPHQQFVNLNALSNRYNYGIRLVSKHKIINWERIKYAHKTTNMAAYFDIEINGEIIRFVGTHLESNMISSNDYHTLVKLDVDEAYKTYALKFFKRLKSHILLRSSQTKTVLEAIKNSPYPVVIMGDLNDTPQSFTYELLQKGRKDAFIEKGNGWGATYLKPFPLLRIDYILYDEELTCTDYKRIRAAQSDHALVEASFRWTK
jgi:endonuclease/exonuclease/phosphatase family metal-dependent hydrolase